MRMMGLPVYNNRTPLQLQENKLKHAQKLLADMIHSLDFFRQKLSESPDMNDVHTHMGLFESYFSELTPLVGYQSVLTEEYQNRYAHIRQLNAEVKRLEEKLGKGISPEGISSKLREYDDAIRCFYGALGFQYASLENCTCYGIRYRIYRDTYHAELLDTDKNKALIQTLFQKEFPGCQFHSFESRRNDFDSYSLRFTMFLPYKDIQAMLTRVVGEEKNESCPN